MSAGLQIQIELKKRGLTQRWLLGELRKRGFGALTEATLSSVLSGSYTVGCADAVKAAAQQIIEAQKGGRS